jgi:hypothetical protein
MLGDWSGDYSPSQTTEHDTLPDPTMLRDSSTMPCAVLEDCFDHSPTTA